MTNINEYQETVKKYADYPLEIGPFYTILGIISTCGTLSEKLRVLLNEHGGQLDSINAKRIAITLGDILRYLTYMASDINVSLEEVIELNMQKMRLEQEKKTKAEKVVIEENTTNTSN